MLKSAPALLLLLSSASVHLQAPPSAAVSGGSDSCALEGYDLGTLYASEYWTIRIPNKLNCMLPNNTTEDEVAGCNVFFSVCKPLNSSVCPDYPNSTTCQEVVTTDGQVHYYDMGAYAEKKFNPISGNVTGFQATRVAANVTESAECNDIVSTGLYFICNPDSKWSSKNPNVTKDVIIAQQLFKKPCLYLIELHYDGACYIPPTLSPSHCSVEDYDTATISSREYWTATVDASACYNTNDISCVMFLAFCHPVPPEIGDTCYNSAICQKGYDQDSNVLELSMGRFTNYTHFYENDEQGENGGFRMKVENGSRPENGSVCPNGLQSEVILVCDKSKEWNSQDISEFVQLVYLHGDDPCMYVVKIGYSGACHSETRRTKPKPSPVGWIFIGLFGFGVLSYLVIGSAIMYFVRGARGVRIFPHYDFWRNVVSLIGEGCRFFLDVITCHRFDGRLVPTRVGVRQPDYDKI